MQNLQMIPGGLPATSPTEGAKPANVKPDDPKLRQASEDFEALLIGQMLQSIRESALSGWQETENQSGAVALEMAESQLARMMAANGGLGLARTLQNSLQTEPAGSGS